MDKLLLSDGQMVWKRLCEISDLIVSLKTNLPLFPSNQYTIDELEAERKILIEKYVRVAPPYL